MSPGFAWEVTSSRFYHSFALVNLVYFRFISFVNLFVL